MSRQCREVPFLRRHGPLRELRRQGEQFPDDGLSPAQTAPPVRALPGAVERVRHPARSRALPGVSPHPSRAQSGPARPVRPQRSAARRVSTRPVQTQRQRYHHLLLDVNARLLTVAATTVLLQAQLSALSRALATPPAAARRKPSTAKRRP